jgi:flavin-dependent dehydrogenase
MNRFDFDAIVIGAGVGGTSAALALAQRQWRVLLLESHEVGRHKVCGEFLSPESRSTFERLGVWQSILEAGARPVWRGRVVTSSRLSAPLPLHGMGRAISRRKLDGLLWSAAQAAGVEAQDRTRVESLQLPEGTELYRVQTFQGEVTARLVVAATGRNARLKITGREQPAAPEPNRRRFLGLKTHLRGVSVPEGEVRLYPFRGGYCGLVTVEDGSANACLLLDYAHGRGLAPAQVWDRIREQNRALAEITQEAVPEFDWIGTGNIAFGRMQPVENGLLRVGDAAGFIHPLTGDGMAMAARAGELAGTIAAEGLGAGSTADVIGMSYAVEWQREFRSRLRWAGWVQPLLTQPWLTEPSLMLFNWLPGLRSLTVARTRG